MHELERRPVAADYDAHFQGYVDLVPAGRLDTLLLAQIARVQAVRVTFAGDRETFAYAPGKWTVRQVMQHIADTERVLAYRLLRLARRDPEPVAGMDHDAFATHDDTSRRSLASICAEFADLRRASVALVVGTDPATHAWTCPTWRTPITFLAQATVLHGHVAHHLNVLDARYR